MISQKILSQISLILCALFLSGCANFSGNRYEQATIGEFSQVKFGYVVSLRKVELKTDDSKIGTAVGSVGGGLLGAAFGGGNAKYGTALAGAAVGGVIGHAIASKPQEGIEYTVKLDDGSFASITQGLTPPISVGQRVRIIVSEKGRSHIVAE